jgi:restriction system protein
VFDKEYFMAPKKINGPQFIQFFIPLLETLKELGGSGRPVEVRDRIAEKLKLPESERAILNESGQARFDNQVHWAKFYLARAGYIESTTKGVWSLTEKGQTSSIIGREQALEIFKTVQDVFKETKERALNTHKDRSDAHGDEKSLSPIALITQETNYRMQLLGIIKQLPPAGFERLCQFLLREGGFEQVFVTGRSGDGGIDGHGVLQLNPFVSFRVLFQCKRYAGSVSASQVRDFRGAMMGRADKGIILTTGTFTAEARKEALRDGVPPIELVDGEKLLDMFEQLEIGLRPRKTYDVDDAFFEPFRTL